MAIYHFSGSLISRSKGKSSIASAAYRSGEKLYDERQQREFDYGRKQDVAYKEIMLPDGAPEWMKNREKLWNAVEAAENRKDSQLAREFNFALPREFTKEQNIELAREFVQNEFIAKGMVADLCIHDGKGKDGEEQPHAHVMLTLRNVTEEGFGLKERSWNAKENLLQWREAWAECANKHLALNDIDQRIDHKTLEGQGIDLEPQKKIGPNIFRVYDTRIEEHQRIAKENGDKILEDPSIALKAITHHQSTFTHQDLARFINRHTVDAQQFQLVYEKVKISEQIITLTDEQGKERFTTKEMQALESKMLDTAIELKNSAHIIIDSDYDVSAGGYLSPQQQDALNHIIDDGDITCLIGYAGTGKSRLLGQAKEIWEKDGYKVHGATLSGIAAENLEAASGIESRTLASRCYYWDKGAEHLTKKDVLVIDEAGMLGSRQVARVLDEVKTAGAKVVFIGDPQQLQAIEAGAAFRAISEQTGYFELTEIRRQQEPWQQEATRDFAMRFTEEAIDLYDEHGCVHAFTTKDTAKAALVEKWDDTRTTHPDKTQIMLSYTRRDAQELNEMARDYRKKNNELGEDQILKTEGGNKDFAVNDRIYFLRNDRTLGVKNGTLGIIENICLKEGNGGQITVRVDRDDLDGNPKLVTFDIGQYGYITHGYAATIHKAQGVTVDQSYILASKHLDSHAIYVGMSRHKESAELFWSREEFADKNELVQALSRDRSKDVTSDYNYRDFDGTSESAGIDAYISKAINIDGENYRKEETHGFYQEEYREKSVSELLKELAVLSKGYDEESVAQKHVRELRELTQSAEQNYEGQKYLQEIKEYLKEQDRNECENKEKYERAHPKDAEIEKQDIVHCNSPEEKRAEKLIERYYGYEDRYYDLEERGGSSFSMNEAKDQMERCGHEICNDRHAMDYLQKNNIELFQEMDHMKELEKTLERERDFDMSL